MLTKILKKGSIVIAPDDCHEYLTAGKEYAVVESGEDNFTIIDDDGDELYCLLEGCAHIEYNDWTIKSDQWNREDIEIVAQAITIGLLLAMVWAVLVVCSAPQ